MTDRTNNLRKQLGPQGTQVAEDTISCISSLHRVAKIAIGRSQNQALIYEVLNNGRKWMVKRSPRRVLSSSLALVAPTIEEYRRIRDKLAGEYFGEKHEYSAWKRELGFTWIDAEDQLQRTASYLAKSLLETLKPSSNQQGSLVKVELWAAKKFGTDAWEKLEELLTSCFVDLITTEKAEKKVEALKYSLSDLNDIRTDLFLCEKLIMDGSLPNIFPSVEDFAARLKAGPLKSRLIASLKVEKRLPPRRAVTKLLEVVIQEHWGLKAQIAKEEKKLAAQNKQVECLKGLANPRYLRQMVDAHLIRFIDGNRKVPKKTILIDQVDNTLLVRACGEEAKKLGVRVGMPLDTLPKGAFDIIDLNANPEYREMFPDLETALGDRLLGDAKKKVGAVLWSIIRFIFNLVARDYFGVQSLEELAKRVVRNGLRDIRGPLPYMMIREVGMHFKTKVLPKIGEIESSDAPYLGNAVLSLKNLAWDWIKPNQPGKKGLLWRGVEKIAKMNIVHKNMDKHLDTSIADLVRAVMKEQPLKAHHAILKALEKPAKKSVIERTIASYKDGMSLAEFGDRFSDHAKSLPLDMHSYLSRQVRPAFLLLTEGKKEEALNLWKNDVRKKQIRELRNLRGRIIVDLKSLKRRELELFDREVEVREMAKWERILSREALRLNERKKKFGLADTRVGQLNALRPLSSNKFEEIVKWAEQKIEELGAEIDHLEGKANANLEEKKRAKRAFAEKNTIELSNPAKLLKMDGERFYEGVMRSITSLMAG